MTNQHPHPQSAQNLESNSISSGGIEALAEALETNGTLKELKLANQHVSFSGQAEMALARSLEANTSLQRLTIQMRNPHPRELMNKALARNQDLVRKARRGSVAAAAGGAGFAGKIADWAAEAARLATSQPFEYGDKLPGDTAGESYVTSGNALWARATDEERRGVIEGFATNSTVCRVEMVNAFVSDALAQLWAAVLAKNATITSLVRRALQPLTSRPQCWRRVG